MELGSPAVGSSLKLRRTGSKSSAARLSLTTKISGRPAARWKRTSIKAFAVGVRPETRMRPVPSLRWEATRAKAGSFSTSTKSSRTKGRSMQNYFSRRTGVMVSAERRDRASWALPDSRGGCLCAVRGGSFRLSAVEGAGEAGGATAAVDTEFAAGESAEVESGAEEAGVGVQIFFYGEQAVVAESEDVAGKRVAFRRIDFDQLESERLE